MTCREMRMDDYAQMVTLWQVSPGVRLIPADSPERIEAFLLRNPGMSFVAEEEGNLVGTVLCGHDGRRGYAYHLAVKPEHRGKHVATRLVEAALEALNRAGIDKCHVFVLEDNPIGNAFWASVGKRREDIVLYSMPTEQ